MEDKEKIELEEGIKPVPGVPSNFGQGTTIFQTDDKGNITRINTSGAPLDTRNVKTKEEYENPVRIGDYYYTPNRTLQAWRNSPTDILQRSQVAVGGTEAPVDTVSLKNEGLGTLGGAAIGSIAGPAGALVGALIGGLTAHNTAAEEALKQWREQDVKYDYAVEFYKDDDGTIKYQFDYDKMGTGGPRSGEAVKEAQNRETEVRLGDDGRLKVKVSPIFASTERFQELMNYVSENYGGLSKDTENLDEVLTEIKNGIDGEAKSYISNMKLYADFAHRFPNASPETIIASYTTEVSGYVKPDEMGDYQVSVLEGDEITTKTAKDFFDSVLQMDKGQRNELTKKLNDIVYGDAEGYDDNKRAIAYGELQSMFVASANTEGYENDKYQGMMDADPFVSFMNNFAPLGLNGADVLSFLSGGTFSKQEYLNQNDFAEFLGGATGIAAGLGIWKGGTKLVEGALKRLPGSAQLFKASVSGMGREELAAAIATGRSGDIAKMWAAELGFKALKVSTFDAALAGTQTAVSGKDFWTEFGQDLARDIILEAVFSYYDMIQFQKFVTDTNVYVYRDAKTGNLKKADTYRGNSFTAYEMSDDGLLTETSYEQVAKVNVVPTGEGKGATVIQTPQGTTVEIINGKIRYTSGKNGIIEGTAVEEVVDEFPSLSTGVANTSPADETDALRKALERDGQPADTEVFQMPSQQADAAIVAGKIAKLQGTKVGAKLYENLFNKNGILDRANNLALAKDGDLNAWRNAQEQFVSVSQNAQSNLQDIQNGVYIKSAAQEWQNTLQVIGGFNYEFKYKPKTDGAYINAINQIQRAQLLNDSRPEGDTTDYVAKALEKYGDTISKMPQDRAEALQGWLEQGKKWLKVFNQSVRKSGKVDVNLLDSYTDTDIEAKIGYFPVWAKRTTYKGLLDHFYGLSQERNPYRDWLRNGEWVPLDELEDPYTAMTRYMGFMANNMGLNDRNETAAKVLERADLLVDNTPTDATIRKRKLDSIKNKDELTKKLDEMVEAKKKEVKEATLTPKQYNDAMTKIYEDSAIEETTEALSQEPENWNDFWKNAPAQTRKDIRNELEKTSLQTGYGISDTRARLNAQVPGADVLEWSLLGRDHTNGLVPGGLYAGKNSPVKAYIMSVDDLAKLAGYDLDNAIPDMGKAIEKHINTKDAVSMLPAHIRGSGDGSEIWLEMRWGHNSDGAANWAGYLKTLKERGIEKVPVAIDDARGDYDMTFYRVRNTGIAQKGLDNIVEALDKAVATGKSPEFTARDISAALHVPGWTRDRLRRRIRHSIPATSEDGVSFISDMEITNLLDEADEYNWSEDEELNSLTDNIESVVEEKLGYVPQDITADVQQAFSEYGQIPWFHSQHAPLGSAEFNAEPPTGEAAYTAQDGVGDALWVAPNSSYTDEYGKNKTMASIPIKYFMSDKEMKKTADEAAKRLEVLHNKMLKLWFNKVKKIKKLPKTFIPAGSQNETVKPFNDFISSHNLNWTGDANTLVDLAGNPYSVTQVRNADGEFLGDEITPYDGETKTVVPSWVQEKEQKKLLSPKEQKEEDLLSKAIYPAGIIKSYRALAEYAGKPVIDTTMDMNERNIAGTAFFYYKGISPEFDEEIGRQLEAQAAGTPDTSEAMQESQLEYLYETRTFPQFLEDLAGDDSIAKLKLADINRLAEDIEGYVYSDPDLKAKRELDLDGKIEELIQLQRGKAPGLSEYVFLAKQHNLSKASKPMLAKWVLGKEPLLEQVHAWSIDDETYADIAEFYDLGEYIMPEEKQAWDAIDPTNFANVPTEPQFKQPYAPTYEDYQKGLLADPNMARRVQESYRGALAQRLIKEASRVVGLAEDYLSAYSWGNDWQSYLNTSLIPDLKDAINQRMLPEEFKNFVQARMVQAIQDVAPYQSPELIMKSQLDNVAQEWREWAEKHIKAGRFTQKDLKEFVGSHNLELPNDKRPYPSKVKHALWQIVEDGGSLPKIEGLSTSKVSKNMDKAEFYKMLDNTPLFQSAVKDKKELVDLVAAEKNGETIDGYTMGVSAAALGLGGRYPWTWYKNGKPYTRFIKYDTPEKQRWAEEFVSLANNKELVKEEGIISRFFSGAANDFRLLTTAWDPSRIYSNITRDTTRSFTIGKRFINAKNTLQSVIDMGDYTPKQKEILSDAIGNAAKNAANSSYNSAYRSPKRKQVAITKEYLSQTGANPMKRFMYNLVHDKRSIAEGPMEFFEGWSRRNNARSLAAVQLGKDQAAGISFKKQLQNAVDAATFAGREYTANFQRKGKLIGKVSKYVAYQSSSYAGFDGMMRAFIDDPKTVSRNFAVFVIAYMILLADTLSREETRKQYYRLSEYDRENQIVIGMGDSILTIPMDQELAGLLYPYRAILEVLEGTDQPSFFQFMWGTFTEWMPMDLSGFSEGDGFNLARGLEKLTAQNMPTGLTPIQEAATGYDLYYGNDISVSDETLKDYGIYDPQSGDYTTNSKDSLFLRNVANLTGIPQWQLQAMWEGYGGNVGKYVLNIIDKTAGATKEQQGGKDFADAVFSSMTALDQDAASNAFYEGLNQLKKEKNSLLQKIANYNEDLKTASGQAKIELQNKIQKAKEEYGTKVGDFVDKYVSAYEITGGLPKKQAQQIYYLFRLDDDDTIYESGSPEEYYNNQAIQKFKNQATAMSAPILDKYYNNRIGNIYQDADGVWRRYLSAGAQAMRNSIYGQGEQQMVDLLNILEGKDSNLTNYRKRIKDARSKAYDAKDWDTRDALGYELDKKVIEAISPYIEKYGAENVLGNTQVLDYLSDWFIVPDDFIRSKKNKYVSLGNNASTQEAFVRPFIKYVFGLPTNFSSYRDARYNSLEIGK